MASTAIAKSKKTTAEKYQSSLEKIKDLKGQLQKSRVPGAMLNAAGTGLGAGGVGLLEALVGEKVMNVPVAAIAATATITAGGLMGSPFVIAAGAGMGAPLIRDFVYDRVSQWKADKAEKNEKDKKAA